MGLLNSILEVKEGEVQALLAEVDASEYAAMARGCPQPIDFGQALVREDGGLAVIAEIKRRSPSKGELDPDLDAASAAQSYEQGGAAALSVLTDEQFFGGSIEDLTASRAAIRLPILRKDFIIHEVQLAEARIAGADAVLLIVAALNPARPRLSDLLAAATDFGMTSLVEVDNERDLEIAVEAGASVIGVNHRDLRRFEEAHEPLDLSVGETLIRHFPVEATAVAMSGIHGVLDAERMASAGFSAVLVGEYFVTAADRPRAVRELSAVKRVRSPQVA